jgi:serine/threonine-protein kinase
MNQANSAKIETIGGRYKVVRLLGAGGMGSVYEAIDSATNQRVAVKVIIAEIAQNQTLMGRFEREARAAAAIDTIHIVKVLDAGQDPGTGQPFMVMEYLDGEDLQQILKRLGPVSPDLVMRVAYQACMALQKAHEQKIVHRDIKPANFFLARGPGGERVVKLLDFGVAKVKADPQSTELTAGLTRTGSMLGSPLYMSPEQARGHKDIDYRSDIWSLGIVLYQALAGRTPHQDTDLLGELLILICTEAPQPLQEIAPWVPPDIASLVHRALRFNPRERFQSAGEMLAAVAPLLGQGNRISEDMLRPLGPHERGAVAARLDTASIHDAPPPRRSATTGSGSMQAVPASYPGPPSYSGGIPPGPPSYSGGIPPGPGSYPGANPMMAQGGTPFPAPGYPGATTAAGAFGTTVGPQGAVYQPAGGMAPPPQRSSAVPVIAAASVIAVALGGVALYRFASPAPSAPIATATAAVQAPPLPGGKTLTVKVVILPAEAKVEVEGTQVTPKDGLVEVSGQLGTVHKVKVSSGGDERTVEVVVTENGALPAKIDLAQGTKPAAATATAPRPGGPRPASTGGGVKPVLRTDR